MKSFLKLDSNITIKEDSQIGINPKYFPELTPMIVKVLLIIENLMNICQREMICLINLVIPFSMKILSVEKCHQSK